MYKLYSKTGRLLGEWADEAPAQAAYQNWAQAHTLISTTSGVRTVIARKPD